jgi:hypothetical protein
LEPSKRFFYWELKKWLSSRSYAVAVDAASADFKNAPVIPANLYVGVDIDSESLERGLMNYGSGVTIESDVTELTDHVASYSVDLCISTHTIPYVGEAKVFEFILSLSSLNNRGGDLIFNMEWDMFKRLRLSELVRSRYEHTIIRRYRTVLSRLYESGANRDDQRRFVTSTKLLPRITNRLIFIAERFPMLKKTGDRVLVMCSKSLNENSVEFKILN